MSDHEAEARKVAEEIAASYWGGNPKAGDQVACTIGAEVITVRQSLANRIERGILSFARGLVESEALYQQERAEHAKTRRTLDAKDHENAELRAEADSLRAQLAEAVEREKAAEAARDRLLYTSDKQTVAWKDRAVAAETGVEERAAKVIARATEAIEASLKQELAEAEATVARMAELLCADCDRRIREDEAALARPEARTPEPKDPLSISYVAVTRGREWPRPEHKRIWNQEQDDSWCSYCHVQWPCDEAKP